MDPQCSPTQLKLRTFTFRLLNFANNTPAKRRQ
ncbi:unnamed protein product [Schistosoma curassoni]|uniref:Uncharacterized protein n=1 Tax=Schistosoma curassoni TaxID=6186 RepID=A0A183KQX6_9TREM|nr:unnamed protein product [Schistosoma curassoni]